MPEFSNPVDIGNRALQRCGADLIDTSLGFTEQSERARQVSSCYGKLRRAELQRNVWAFATRKACLRAVDINTYLLAPTLWSSVVTYFAGSIVEDAAGTLWVSKTRDNLANQPQNTNNWEPYFGPMTVALYDSSQIYFTGELVYTAAGDGTYNVYESLTEDNPVHPALPNQWSTNTAYKKDQIVQQFPVWSSLTTYSQGQTVFYNGSVYSSLINSNLNVVPSSSVVFVPPQSQSGFYVTENASGFYIVEEGLQPSTSPGDWALMPLLIIGTPLVPVGMFPQPAQPQSTPIAEWAQEGLYSTGSFVIFNGLVYVSLVNGNVGNFPNAAASTSWVLTTLGVLYMSLIDVNIGNAPSATPALWAVGTTYASGAVVGELSTGLEYVSQVNSNTGNDPALDNGTNWKTNNVALPWTTSFVQGGGNQFWLQIGGSSFPNGVGLDAINIRYPLSLGPTWQMSKRNVFRLPANYLRKAPQDPKAGRNSFLGYPSNLWQDDWTYQGNYLTSTQGDPIMYRFVCDVQNVTEFTDMFCEGLACRIALEVAPRLTQNLGDTSLIAKEYEKFMGEARLQNAIEVGVTEPPMDDYIACRV